MTKDINMDNVEDIKHSRTWMNLVRRLHQMACTQSGLAAITVTIFVNQDGYLFNWTEPKRTCLEPKNSAQQMLELMEIHNK